MYVVLRKILLYTDIILQEHQKSCAEDWLGWMAISEVSCKFDSDNLDFVELEYIDVGLSTR